MEARPSLRLRPLGLDDEAQALAANDEHAREGWPFLLQREAGDTWAAYLARLARHRGGECDPGMVPAAFLGAFAGEQLIGRASLRFTLNDFLRNRGGHVGYGVRPAHRRRGHAGEILRQSLVILRAEGVDRVLVTCDDDNVASARTIERHGGVLEDVRAFDGDRVRRYWIA